MTRPLTDAGRIRIEAARRKLDALDAQREAILRELHLAIRDAFDRRGNVSEIAEAGGYSRKTIYALLERLSDDRA